jgi:hypothetical protein
MENLIAGVISSVTNNVQVAPETADNKTNQVGSTQNTPVKKRPGRPRKNIENVPVEFKGIVENPFDVDDYVEMVYTNPRLFKRINVLYKNYTCSEICFNFTENTVEIIAVDRYKVVNAYTTFDSKLLNHYWCKTPVSIWVKRESIEKIFSTIDKTTSKITFILKSDYRSNLYILIHDLEYDSVDNYVVEVICKPADVNFIPKFDDVEYPIKFTLSSKHLKRKINDISKVSNNLIIIKEGDNPLQLTYEEAKMINYNGVYNNNEKINLKSNITPTDTFMISTKVSHIRPFSNSNFGENVHIAASRVNNISFTTLLDKSSVGAYIVEVKVFVQIDTAKDVVA